MSLTDLIAALEAAEGPNRELDAQIWFATNRKAAETTYWNAALGMPHTLKALPRGGLGYAAVVANAPRYTGSLDDALTLVPEGWWLSRIDQYHAGRGPLNWWGVHLRHTPLWDRGKIVGEHTGSLANALCIACLRALDREDARR